MGKISKTAAASMRGGPVEKKADPFDTNEKKIRELRVQRLNGLAVNRFDFIDALLVEYDLAVAGCVTLGNVMKALTDKMEGIVGDRDIQIHNLTAQLEVANQKLDDSMRIAMDPFGTSSSHVVNVTESEKLQAQLEPLPGDAAGAIMAKAEDEASISY